MKLTLNYWIYAIQHSALPWAWDLGRSPQIFHTQGNYQSFTEYLTRVSTEPSVTKQW